jgi:peptide/nickel transport system permease protein
MVSLVVVEVVFASPGIGIYTAQSIPKSDFPGIAGVTLHMGATYVLANTAVDLLQAAADPRLRTN